MSELTQKTALELAGDLHRGDTTAAEITDAFLARIAAEEPALGAFAEIYADDARSAARAADAQIAAGYRRGPLHGIPIVVKDLVDWDGRVTTGGSQVHARRVARATAPVLRRLLDAGLIVLGKTKTVEFAFGGWGTNARMGTPHNPWDRRVHRVPGGSSSGTAVAVAAALAPWGIGTDTGGLVRLPAAFCGLVGLKTTAGRIPTAGIQPLSPTLDSVGPLARSTDDALVLDRILRAVALPDIAPADLVARLAPAHRRGVAGLRIARLPAFEFADVESTMRAAHDAALERLAAQGAEIVDVALPFAVGDIVAENGRIMAAEGYAAHGELADDPETPLDEAVRARLLGGREITAAAYLRTLAARRSLQAEYAQATAGIDALVTPSLKAPAIPVAEVDEAVSPAHFTRFGNYLDLCGTAVPVAGGDSALPLSVQVICAPDREDLSLRIAEALLENRSVPPAP